MMKRNLSIKIWVYTLLVIAMGLVALYSASFDNVRVSQKIFYDQLFFAGIGCVLMYLISRIDYRRFYDVAYIFYGLNVVMLLWVLIRGHHALGATRWLSIGGVNFQPSEITKVALILALGRYLSNRRPTLSFNFLTRTHVFFRDVIWPFMMSALVMLLIFKQPDLGTSLLMIGIFVVMIFVAEVEYKYVLGFLGACLSVVPFAWGMLKDYQKDRLLVFLNPNIDPLGAGYTIIQSKIAVGAGQIFGKGWLAGTQNQLNFLPERHTDFIFSVIGEEWGFVGGVLLLLFYFGLIQASLDIASQIKDKFGMLITSGIVAILTMQVVINVGMVMGVFPIVGLTLPLVSYGRSSFLVFIVMMGMLLSLSRKRSVFS